MPPSPPAPAHPDPPVRILLEIVGAALLGLAPATVGFLIGAYVVGGSGMHGLEAAFNGAIGAFFAAALVGWPWAVAYVGRRLGALGSYRASFLGAAIGTALGTAVTQMGGRMHDLDLILVFGLPPLGPLVGFEWSHRKRARRPPPALLSPPASNARMPAP